MTRLTESERRHLLKHSPIEVNSLIPDGAISEDDLFELLLNKYREENPNLDPRDSMIFAAKNSRAFREIFDKLGAKERYTGSDCFTSEDVNITISYLKPEAVNSIINSSNLSDFYKKQQISNQMGKRYGIKNGTFQMIQNILKSIY